MRVLKIAAYAVGGLLALLVLAALAIVMFVDPNDYRDGIAAQVEARTGRKLTLSGDLQLAVFPWIALETGAASLSERPGFGDEPFVSIEGARLSVRLWPLLRGALEIGDVRLQGARIRLITNEQGQENWADLRSSETPTDTAAPTSTALPTVAGLEIRDAAIVLDNRQTKVRRVVRDFNLDSGRLQSGEPFALTTDFVLDEGASLSLKVHVGTTVTADLKSNAHRLADPEIDITVMGQGYPPDGIPVQIRAGSLSMDIDRSLYQLDGLNVTAVWKGDGFPAAGVPLALQARQLSANLALQTVELTELQAEVAGATLSGGLRGEEILDNPRLAGPLRLAPVTLREWLPKLGVTLPVTADPKVLGAFSLAGKVAVTKETAAFDELELKLDGTTAKGSLGIANFSTKALRFDLDVDRINADRYLAPAPATQAKSAQAKSDSPPVEIPIEALRALNVRGELRIGEAVFAGVKFTKLKLGVNGRDGKVRLNPLEAAMYGGTYRGDIGVDASGDTARVSLDERVSSVAFAPLFKQLFDSERFSGKGSATLKAAGSGRNSDELLRTLDGNLTFDVVDGAFEGTDLWYEIRRARALLRQQPVPERPQPVRTAFSALKGSGAIDEGVVTNNDLDVSMQYLKVAGKGTLDLSKQTLDYRLLTTVLRIPREGADAAQAEELVNAEIPVKVTGTFDEPKVRPDLEGLAKARVKEELKKQEDKLRDKLGDKLKDIFR